MSPVRAEVQASAARPEPKWARESQRYASALVAASGEVVDEAVEVDDGGGGVALERSGLTDAEQCEPGVGAEGMGEGDAEPCVLRGDAVPLEARAEHVGVRAVGLARAGCARRLPGSERGAGAVEAGGVHVRDDGGERGALVARCGRGSLRAGNVGEREEKEQRSRGARGGGVVTLPRWRACATPCAAAARRGRGVPRPPPS